MTETRSLSSQDIHEARARLEGCSRAEGKAKNFWTLYGHGPFWPRSTAGALVGVMTGQFIGAPRGPLPYPRKTKKAIRKLLGTAPLSIWPHSPVTKRERARVRRVLIREGVTPAEALRVTAPRSRNEKRAARSMLRGFWRRLTRESAVQGQAIPPADAIPPTHPVDTHAPGATPARTP